MSKRFDGKKISQEIASDLKKKIAVLSNKPTLAIVSIGNNSISEKYIEIKKKFAKNIGLRVLEVKLAEKINQREAEEKIKHIDADGIIIQMPISKSLDREALIKLIPKDKDVDGLRFCIGANHKFFPPVILAILEALKLSNVNLIESKVLIIGQGFLVGTPLARILKDQTASLEIADELTSELPALIKTADIVVSATGKVNLINVNMIKSGAIIIDAGATEIGGKLVGDIASECYIESSFFTPVPGGIGPVTVAMLFKNLIENGK